MDSQPTDKVEGVDEDFVRGGQDKIPTKKNAIVTRFSRASEQLHARQGIFFKMQFL
jgi:hypothetical protein